MQHGSLITEISTELDINTAHPFGYAWLYKFFGGSTVGNGSMETSVGTMTGIAQPRRFTRLYISVHPWERVSEIRSTKQL